MRMRLSRRGRTFGWPALAVSGLLIAATGTLVVKAELSNALKSTPELALKFEPGNPQALVRLAEGKIAGRDGSSIDLRGAHQAASAALRQSPLLPAAWRILGTSVSDDTQTASSRLEFAESLSRRDMPTQLALIEYRSAEGDLTSTLSHYDTILRVDASYDPVLLPVLGGAIENPLVLRAAARQLRTSPWRRRFFSYLAEAGIPFSRQADLFVAMAKQGVSPDGDIVTLQAQRAAGQGDYAAALRLYELIYPAEAAKLLRNPSFSEQDGLPPFDWQIETNGVLNVLVSRETGGARLEMTSERGDAGRGAQQLLHLAPGQYQLSALTGPIDGYKAANISISLSCATTRPISTFTALANSRKRIGGSFRVPEACAAQWLEVSMKQSADDSRTGAWVNSFSLTSPLSGRPMRH